MLRLSTKNYLGNNLTIVEQGENGQEVPALHLLNSQKDFPGGEEGLRLFASNLVSVLNGGEPLFKIEAGDQALFWSRIPNGIDMRVKKPKQEGVTRPSVIVAINGQSGERLFDDIKEKLTSAALMGKLFDSVVPAAQMAQTSGASQKPGVR